MKKYIRACKECGGFIVGYSTKITSEVYDEVGNCIKIHILDEELDRYECEECGNKTGFNNSTYLSLEDISILI